MHWKNKLFATLFYVVIFAVPSQSNAEPLSWSIPLNSKLFFERYFEGSLQSDSLFIPTMLNISVGPQRPLSDGKTTIQTADVIISVIMHLRDGGTILANDVKHFLPKPGCNDSSDVASETYASRREQDLRSPDKKSITFHARAFGTERACEWPKGTYGTWWKPFNLSVRLAFEDDTIKLIPKIRAESTQIDKTVTGRLGAESLRIINQIASTAGGGVNVPNPGETARRMDARAADRLEVHNRAIAGDTVKLPQSGFWSANSEGPRLLRKFSWSGSSGYVRHRSIEVRCGRRFDGSRYVLWLNFSSKGPISFEAISDLSSNLRSSVSGVANGSFGPAISQKDTSKQSSVCPSKRSHGCFSTLGGGRVCRIEP